MKRKKTASALLRDRYIADDPESQALLEEERANLKVASKIRALREAHGLSQRQLAKRVGTTASAICRLESADYEGHSLAMLQRIAAAVGKRIEIRFVKPRASA
ncbi:MAG: helix-turn-helix transcriptional regulator [Candidatus Hydrogenedentota bacterium]